nr:immunoglobulin heavy chain junction region [Macaca mulatta]
CARQNLDSSSHDYW